MTDPKRQTSPAPAKPDEDPELNDAEIDNLLERAAQNVKPLVEEELAGEVIGAELWNFRLQVKK
jgi:hypothetical protein